MSPKAPPKVTQRSAQDIYRSLCRKRKLYNQYAKSTPLRTSSPISNPSSSSLVIPSPVPVPREPATLLSLPVELRVEVLRSLLVVPYQQTLQSKASRHSTEALLLWKNETTNEASRRRSVQETIDQRINMEWKGRCHACADLEPSFSNQLHNSILRVNHQLYLEAIDVTLENRFVFVTGIHDLATDLLWMQLLERYALQPVGIVLNRYFPLPEVKPLLTIHLAIADPNGVESSPPCADILRCREAPCTINSFRIPSFRNQRVVDTGNHNTKACVRASLAVSPQIRTPLQLGRHQGVQGSTNAHRPSQGLLASSSHNKRASRRLSMER